MAENTFINLKNKSFSISADTKIPSGGANGVLLAQAGKFGGWSFYLKDGKPNFTYNFLGDKQFKIAAPDAVPEGASNIRLDFVYDGGGAGKGGTGTISVNGKKVAEGRIDQTQGFVFSADEGADVGADLGTAVSSDYKVPFKFTGTIDKIKVDIAPVNPADKAEHDKAFKDGSLKKELSD